MAIFIIVWRDYMLKAFLLRKGCVSNDVLFKLGIILCWLGWAVFFSLKQTIYIPTAHLDGAFQTASGLFRLDDGQFPGKDFYPYLGIGPLLVLYPFFKAFGANMSASIFSAQLTVLLVGVLSTALIWQFIWRPRLFITSLSIGCVLFLAPIGVADYLSLRLPNWMMFNVMPGNSLRPIRAAVPYFASIVYYFFIFKIDSPGKRYATAGLLTGSILLWSNDFAIPTAGMLVFLISSTAFCRNEFQIRNSSIYFIASILSWAALLSLTTSGHPLELLKYNFFDVAHDQWWFFASYGESRRIFNLWQLDRLFSQENYFPLFILAFTAILTLRTRLIEHVLLLWVGAVLFAGGVVASVGGHLGGYFRAFYFWGMMVVWVGIFRLVWPKFKKTSDCVSQFKLIPLLILLGLSVFLMINRAIHVRQDFYVAKNDSNLFYVPELGGYLNKQWNSYIVLARETSQTGVFEEYWGLWSALRKTFASWPVDSVIHALGRTRVNAAKELRGAEVIITTRPSASPKWQAWNLSQNYWFYENLLREWTPSALSPSTIVWRRSEHSRQFKDVGCNYNNNGSQLLFVQADHPGYYEIDIQYKLTGSGRFLMMLRNNISFAPKAHGYVSIDPRSTSAKFPVYIEKAGITMLDTKIIGSNKAILEIKLCAAKYIPSIDPEVLPMRGVIDDDFFLSDNSWLHGIARSWAGFFVPNTPQFADEYKVGRFVKIYVGEIRQIMRTEPNGRYLNIYISGDPLDPEKAGLPSEFAVLDEAVQIPKEGKK
jgi:hypothetical protein